MATEKKTPDWLRIEAEFRAGRVLRAISQDHGVSHVAIQKRAKKEDWQKDLAKTIRTKAAAEVNKRAVNKKVNKARRELTEKQIVDSSVAQQVQVRESHRTDIKRVKSLLHMMLAEAESQAKSQEADIFTEIKEVLKQAVRLADSEEVEALAIKAEIADLKAIYRKAMGLPVRIGALKQITETLALLIRLEREAYGIDADEGGENALADALKTLMEMKKNGIVPTY